VFRNLRARARTISPAGNCRVTQDAPGPPRVDDARQSNSYVAFMNGWVIQARIPMPRRVYLGRYRLTAADIARPSWRE